MSVYDDLNVHIIYFLRNFLLIDLIIWISLIFKVKKSIIYNNSAALIHKLNFTQK